MFKLEVCTCPRADQSVQAGLSPIFIHETMALLGQTICSRPNRAWNSFFSEVGLAHYKS